ncbi:MAG: ferric reductase-like transmembrane domain-containing protein [Bacteroidales bacterium]|jgi:DMSO/TMAO reductase YedYZ heme-binding membrane subunit|nr:ferric reductase-like transmembrane domain-containing protein [Bacteroidales bacterium]
MIKLLLDFIQFLYTLAPLLMALGVLTLLALLLSGSIKKHATAYYIAMSIPFAMVAIPFVCRLLGVEMFNFNRIPLMGSILRDYIHVGTLGFPLLIIIMYVGALNPKNPYVKKLLGIRKELSILSGFPILAHSLIRVAHNFPNALRFFTDHEGYMAGGRVTNALGAGISNFSFVLGVLMLALFLPLWVTSFDFVRKRMGSVRWKKWQRWSYVLYATLFIHAMGIQVGGMLNPMRRGTPHPTVEVIAAPASAPAVRNADNQGSPQRTERSERNGEGGERGDRRAVQPADNGNRTEAARPAGREGHQQSWGFADINVSPQAKRYIHIASLLLIFGSYLYLRLRKAKQDAAKKQAE